jgi:lipopolysaccharide export system permease protein
MRVGEMFKTINRYILREIAVPFFMILFVLTFVLLMGKILQLMDMMVNKGVSVIDIGRLVFYLTPSFLIFTVPISLLVSILMGLGRLSGDNEITVLKASGVSLYRLSHPVAVITLFALVATIVIGFFLVPYGNFATKNLLFRLASQKASIGIKEKVFNDDFRGVLLYAEKVPVHGDFMEGVFVYDERTGREPSTIVAKRAYLLADAASLAVVMRLETGSSHTTDTNLRHYRKMDFSTYDIRLDIASSLSEEQKAKTKASTEMTVKELAERVKSRDLEEAAARELTIELNKKLSIPFACVVFGIIGIPLGIRKHRSAKARGFTVGFFTVLTYYVFQLGGEALAETGRISPVAGAWTANVIFIIIGLTLFIAAARERLPEFTIGTDLVRILIRRKRGRRL